MVFCVFYIAMHGTVETSSSVLEIGLLHVAGCHDRQMTS